MSVSFLCCEEAMPREFFLNLQFRGQGAVDIHITLPVVSFSFLKPAVNQLPIRRIQLFAEAPFSELTLVLCLAMECVTCQGSCSRMGNHDNSYLALKLCRSFIMSITPWSVMDSVKKYRRRVSLCGSHWESMTFRLRVAATQDERSLRVWEITCRWGLLGTYMAIEALYPSSAICTSSRLHMT